MNALQQVKARHVSTLVAGASSGEATQHCYVREAGENLQQFCSMTSKVSEIEKHRKHEEQQKSSVKVVLVFHKVGPAFCAFRMFQPVQFVCMAFQERSVFPLVPSMCTLPVGV